MDTAATTTHRLPLFRGIAVPLAVLAAGAAVVVLALARFWGTNPEYADRFLILLGAAYAAWWVRPELIALAPRPMRFGYLPLLLGAVAFPVGWFLVAQVGPRAVVLWWLTLAWVLAAAGFVLTVGGWKHLRLLAFPLGFVLFALPVPNRILVPLQFALQSATTSIAAWALPLLGIAVERSGFVLSLPGGDLGVAEACSGVRSVTALTAIAAFVAWWKGFGPVRGTLLVGLSIPVIAGVNAVRVIVSGLLLEHAGGEYVRGHWHEGLGVVMVLLGLGLIVLLAHLMTASANPERERRGEVGKHPSPGGEAPPPSPRQSPGRGVENHPVAHAPGSPRFVVVLLACSAFATIAAQLLGVGAEQDVVAAAPLDQIPHRIGNWEGTDIEVPAEVTEMMTQDRAIRRVYRDFGYEVHAWVIYWSSKNMVKGYHHPDVCWPNRGFKLLQRDVVPIQAGGGTVPITVREFARDSHRQLILYWTQEGRRVWTEEDEERVRAAGDSHDWLGERLFRREAKAETGRLVVLVGTTVWGDGAAIRAQTLDFTAKLAAEVYRVCPWAAPPE